jgi:hypothetical protein
MAEETTTEKTVIEFGTAELVEHLNAKTERTFTGASLRTLLRKLIKDGVLEPFEGRYSFDGAKDPRVVAIVKAVNDGAAEAADAERKAALKAKNAEKKAAAAAAKGEAAPAKKKSKTKKAEPVVEEEEVEDDDLDEL